MLIEWSDQLSVHVEGIDKQHQHLIDLMNKLDDAVAAGKGRDVVMDTLAELSQYTIDHFTDEEESMRRHAYPRYEQHSKIHSALIDRLGAIMAEYEVHGVEHLAEETLAFLKVWLIEHLQGEDRQFGSWLVEQTGSAAA